MGDLTASPAWAKIVAAVEHDETRSPGFHDYRAKLEWIRKQALHYAERTGIPAEDILESWESRRTYWYMNYYQEANQPTLDKGVRIFPTREALRESIAGKGFRCPRCNGVSTDPFTCDSGAKIKEGRKEVSCNWKAYGFLGTIGKGIHVLVLDHDGNGMRQAEIFRPVAWELEAP